MPKRASRPHAAAISASDRAYTRAPPTTRGVSSPKSSSSRANRASIPAIAHNSSAGRGRMRSSRSSEEGQLVLPDLQLVAVREDAFLDPPAVEERPVERAEV